MSARRYDALTWPEVPDALASRWLVLPTGGVEQHGPHLPLSVDSLLAERLAARVAERVDGFVAPTVTYGARSLPGSGGGHRYPGTVHLPGDLLIQVYAQLVRSFIGAGARRLLVLNGHWENEAFLHEAVDQVRERGELEGRTLVALSWWSVVGEADVREIFGAFPGWHAEHAGQTETALVLALAPELAHMDRAVDHHGAIPAGIYRHPAPDAWCGTQGVLCPTVHATAEQGRRLLDLIVDRLVALLAPGPAPGLASATDRRES